MKSKNLNTAHYPKEFFATIFGDTLEKYHLDLELRFRRTESGVILQRWYYSLKQFEDDWGSIRELNNKGYDVDFTVVPREYRKWRNREHPLPRRPIITCFWADNDAHFDRVKNTELVPNILVSSGRGLHSYYCLRHPRKLRPSRITRLLTGLATNLDAEVGAPTQPKRLMRVPNTVNWKHGKLAEYTILNPKKYRLTELEAAWQKSEPDADSAAMPTLPQDAKYAGLFRKHVRGLVVGGNGFEARGLCPFHDDKNPSFSVNLMTGVWTCHSSRCRVKGNVEQFCKRLGIPNPQGRERERLPRTAQYWIEGRQICKAGSDGATVQLCNFTARVKREISLDNGVEVTRALEIKGRLRTDERLPTVRVPAARFGAMNWILEHWGSRAIVAAGFSRRDQLREAIQQLSPRPKQRHVFTHTGWREIDGQWVFITGSGAIGGKHIHVDLDPELARYSLPSTPEKPDKAMRASLRLLELAPLTVTVPLWAAMFRAPLGGVLPSNLTVWIEGATGSFKSTFGGLFLCHYGQFDNTSLPGSWESTANQLEHRAFVLKDVPFLIDDYAPKPLLAFRELETKAARLLRAQGNLSGRGRLRPDATERPAHPPRGLIIATGEQHPAGRSLLARCLIDYMKQEQVNVAALTEAQETAHLLPHAMSGFIEWLAPQMRTLSSVLRNELNQTRAFLQGSGHSRVPEVIASLWLGVDFGVRYAITAGACSRDDGEKLREKCWKALLRLAKVQQVAIEAERPTVQFLRVLFTLLSQGRAVLYKRTSNKLPDSHNVLVGWYDENSICLIPEAAYREVAKFQRDSGETFPLRQERLGRELFEEGLSERDKEHFTVLLRAGGTVRRVIRLYRDEVERLLGERLPVTGVTAFQRISDTAAEEAEDSEIIDGAIAQQAGHTLEKPVAPVTTPISRLYEPKRYPREIKRYPRTRLRYPRLTK